MVFSKIKTLHLILALALMLPLFDGGSAAAQNLLQKSVEIGDSRPSSVTTNEFKFTIPGYDNIGSVEFEYCTNSPFIATHCDAPDGLSTNSVNLTSQSGETGFSVLSTTNNSITIARPSSATAAVPVSYRFDNIVNPEYPGKTVYVRISTFTSEDATGPRIDTGAVAFVTTNNLIVRGYVPPYLIFCVGVTVSLDCSSSNGNFTSMGELSSSQPRATTSQFSGSTNDPNGYSVHLIGTTMTSGNNIIPGMTQLDVARPGNGQFGMNLRSNPAIGVGSEPDGPGTTAPTSTVGVQNQFYFNNDIVALANTATDYKRFTATYMANVEPGQPPGIYSTTLTYIAVATF